MTSLKDTNRFVLTADAMTNIRDKNGNPIKPEKKKPTKKTAKRVNK